MSGGEHMTHAPYTHIVPGADTAVLFLHGIIGTPRHFDAFVRRVPADASVMNLLLDGHGKGVRDFSKTSMKKWISQVDAAVDELARTHDKVMIAAHSMGTLFAIRAAISRPDRVKALFLLAVPLRLSVKGRMIQNVWKVYTGNICADDAQGIATRDAYGIERDLRLWRYMGWIPRYAELFVQIRRTRRLLPALAVPTVAYQSAQDEMVSPRAADLLAANPHVAVHVLEHSAHYYYDATERELLLADFEQVCGG